MNKKAANLFILLFNPSVLVNKSNIQKLKYIGLGISAFSFLLFFLQRGLDRFRIQMTTGKDIAVICIAGFIFGAFFIFLQSVVLKMLIKKISILDLISELGLCFSMSVIINIIGLLLNIIFKMNTSIVFGITGILFSLIPTYDIVLKLFESKKHSTAISLTYITVTGCICLCVCSLLMMWKG